MGDSSATKDTSASGTTASTQSLSNSSTKDPWAPATNDLQNILGLTPGQFNATSNPATNNALVAGQNLAISNATGGQASALAGQAGGAISSLFSGGGLTPQQQQALSGISGSLGAFNTNTGTAASYLAPIASGSQIGANNPQFAAGLNQALGDARDTIDSTAAGWGGSGSVAQSKALADRLGTVASNAYATQYNQDKANQLSAIGQLTGLDTSALSGGLAGATAQAGIGQQSIANILSGIGVLPTVNNAANSDANTLMTVGQGGWSNLDNYASLISSLSGLGGSTTGTSSGTSSGTNDSTGTETDSNGGSILGDLLLGTGAAKNLFSDRRLKEDVEPVGALFDGQTIYRFRYRGEPAWRIGLMAQDVSLAAPSSVHRHLSGFLTVDYRAATDAAATIGRAA